MVMRARNFRGIKLDSNDCTIQKINVSYSLCKKMGTSGGEAVDADFFFPDIILWCYLSYSLVREGRPSMILLFEGGADILL